MKKTFWKKYPIYLFCFYILIWIILAIKPVNRADWFLENIVVFISVPIIILVHYKLKLSNFSYTMIALFLIVHAVGAHYTYSQTPFFSHWGSHKFNRDNYDRLAHFSFGFLLYYPVREFMMKFLKSGRLLNYYVPWAVLISFSAKYEVFEWMIALIVSPENAIAFTGTQGDVFDTHKDMALALAGSLITMISTVAYNKLKNKDE